MDINTPCNPNYRLTIRNNSLTLAPWNAALPRGGGPGLAFVRSALERGVYIVDVTQTPGAPGSTEIIAVSPLSIDLPAEVKDSIAAWAQAVGHARIWFHGEIRDLEPAALDADQASVDCPACDATWTDASPAFWLSVRSVGAFPTGCPACGSQLPQWDVAISELSAP